MKADLRQRLTQSIETATSLAEGLVVVDVIDGAMPDGSKPKGIRAR